jgi:hypothetical protein
MVFALRFFEPLRDLVDRVLQRAAQQLLAFCRTSPASRAGATFPFFAQRKFAKERE